MESWAGEELQPPEHRCIIFGGSTTPIWRIQDRSWYSRGKIFKIRDTENRHIGKRVMISLAATGNSSVVCLALCEHDVDEWMHPSFWDTHTKVYDTKANKSDELAISKKHKNTMLGLNLEPGTELLEGSFVNFEHPYTIKITDVRVAKCARVAEKDIVELMETHKRVYNNLIARGFKEYVIETTGPAQGSTNQIWS